jgi:hypothetical protein
MRRPALLVGLILVSGLAGTVLALRSREGNSQFVAQQQGRLPVAPAAVDRLVLTTNDPRPGYGGRAVEARCVSARATALGNPWTCLVRYPRLPRVLYALSVYADGSIYGSGRPQGASAGSTLSVRGCCVGAP